MTIIAESMTWPEAFAIVGGGLVTVAFLWVMMRRDDE
jgi:hypothetical protein